MDWLSILLLMLIGFAFGVGMVSAHWIAWERRQPRLMAETIIDAQRYRWLREGGEYVVRCKKATFHCGGHAWQVGSGGYSEAFDAAIDEQLRKANGKL